MQASLGAQGDYHDFGPAVVSLGWPVIMETRPNIERTATGRAMLAIAGDCSAREFHRIANEIVTRFGMRVLHRVAGLDEVMWLVQFEDDELCISWDIWFPNVTIMPWKETPDDAIRELHARWLPDEL